MILDRIHLFKAETLGMHGSTSTVISLSASLCDDVAQLTKKLCKICYQLIVHNKGGAFKPKLGQSTRLLQSLLLIGIRMKPLVNLGYF